MKNSVKLLKLISLVILSVFFLFFSGCAIASALAQFGYIRGMVTDSYTGKALSGVYVSTYDYYSDDYDHTDSDGSYVLTLAGGTYDIRFEKDGYDDVRLYDIVLVAPFTRSLDVAMDPINPTPTPSPTPGDWEYIYASHAGNDNRFSAFYVEKNTGELTIDASTPANTGVGPAGILNIASQNRLFVANSLDRTVSVYNSSGTYNQISVSPISLTSTDGNPYKMVHDTIGGKIFLTMKSSSNPGKIEILNISDANNPYSEGLINAPEYPSDPQDIKLHSSSGHIFTNCRNSNTIAAYDIRNSVQSGTFSVSDPAAIAVPESGNRLYVAGGSTRLLSVLDITDPSSISQIGSDVTISSDTSRQVVACVAAQDRNLLFTLETGASGSVLKAWSTASTPPALAQQEIFLGNSTASDLLYDNVNQLLFVCHDGAGSDGIHVFNCRNYPSGQISEVYGSPFYQGNQYFMLGR